ncbi:(Fe-S)-binding protein [Candidatus Bathyarchaeota archaeon]|nr:(Fe-S)-binding protein [Candidatus Bathyarchaeota archaeon]
MKLTEVRKRGLEKELYSCAQCGYCQDICPIYCEIPWESASPRGKLYWIKKSLTTGFLRSNVELDEDFSKRLYQCTLCGRCHVVCQTMIDTISIWYTARAQTSDAKLRPKTLSQIVTNLEKSQNPYGMDPDTRLDWTDYTGLDDPPLKEKAEIAYFVGCTTAFKGINQNIAFSTSKILNHMGEDWTLLSKDEWCCGSPLLMAGEEEKAKKLAEHNLEELKKRGVKILLTGCPSCYRMWKIEIPKLLGINLDFKVVHTSEYFHNKLSEGKITITPSDDIITYHDPCELSRLSGIIDEPREILKSTSEKYVEIPEHGIDVRCCGGGGLLQANDNELRMSIAKRRLDQIKSTNAKTVTSACPSCNITLNEAIRESKDNIKCLDIAEYLAEKLGF